MTAPLALPNLTAAEARKLTDEIRHATERVWALLLEAHERRAWAALGYSTWESYVRAEFDMTRRRSYQILDQGKVIREITAAAGVCTDVHIPEAEARDLKPRLALVADQVRERVAAAPPEQVESVVREVITEERAKLARQREDREAIEAFNREFAPPGFDAEADKAQIRMVMRVFDALHTLAGLPPAEEILSSIPDYQTYRLQDLPAAVRWLNDFAERWARQ